MSAIGTSKETRQLGTGVHLHAVVSQDRGLQPGPTTVDRRAPRRYIDELYITSNRLV